MFEKVLVANHGDAAVRIIRACKRSNIHTVAIYWQADANSLHVQLADEVMKVYALGMSQETKAVCRATALSVLRRSPTWIIP